MNLKLLYQKYKHVILYGFFGVCTTLVNMLAYWVTAHLLSLGTLPSTIIAWILAVLFAYVTNKKWVFESDAATPKEIFQQMLSFFSCRLATGVIDWAIMFVLVDLCHMHDLLIKALANIVVIILNYVASKLFVFVKRRK